MFHNLLADTWWYGLTARMTDDRFERLARLRREQGFNAVQLVAGIPPEVGPENPNASSPAGFPWRLGVGINQHYLSHARERISFLNSLGLRVIVYGAWGHQIEWTGIDAMAAWWRALIEALDDCEVIYCLTGELTLWLGDPDSLLPDGSTGDLIASAGIRAVERRFPGMLRAPRAARERYHRIRYREDRIAKWSAVFEAVRGLTQRPWIVHPVPGETGSGSLRQGEQLAAETVQTGHSEHARFQLHDLPARHARPVPFLNVEPWYEGIGGGFGGRDQWYAFLASRLSGASGHCYGAQGIWNCGDGSFLAHWGTQTLEGAEQLSSPWLLGAANRFLAEWHAQCPNPSRNINYQGKLRYIELTCTNRKLTWCADPGVADLQIGGTVWSPAGNFDPAPMKQMPLVYSGTSHC